MNAAGKNMRHGSCPLAEKEGGYAQAETSLICKEILLMASFIKEMKGEPRAEQGELLWDCGC